MRICARTQLLWSGLNYRYCTSWIRSVPRKIVIAISERARDTISKTTRSRLERGLWDSYLPLVFSYIANLRYSDQVLWKTERFSRFKKTRILRVSFYYMMFPAVGERYLISCQTVSAHSDAYYSVTPDLRFASSIVTSLRSSASLSNLPITADGNATKRKWDRSCSLASLRHR